jgi:hypothetical protein
VSPTAALWRWSLGVVRPSDFGKYVMQRFWLEAERAAPFKVALEGIDTRLAEGHDPPIASTPSGCGFYRSEERTVRAPGQRLADHNRWEIWRSWLLRSSCFAQVFAGRWHWNVHRAPVAPQKDITVRERKQLTKSGTGHQRKHVERLERMVADRLKHAGNVANVKRGK